jgi:hypothetical protein
VRIVASFLLAAALGATGFNAPAPARVVAVADVHGGFQPFVSILTAAGLIDARHRWSGGNAVLVQTGDVTDRGAGVREALDLLMALEKEAAAAGGKVHMLLGNHEVMNMAGDTRDVSPEALGSLGGEAGYRAAFGRDGKYGKWLRTKPMLLNLDGTVFMHAGINLDYSTESLDELNARVRREIAEWDEGRRWLEQRNLIKPSTPFLEIVLAARSEIDRVNAIMAEKKHLPPEVRRDAGIVLPVANIGSSSLFQGNGPLWFRGFATWTDEEGAARMAAVLKHHRVNRFVTGHSTQASGLINERFGGSLFLIDTGMLNGRFYPGGRPSALEITAGVAKPVYPPETQ